MRRRSSPSDAPLISWLGSAAFCHLLAGLVLRALAPATAAAAPAAAPIALVEIQALPEPEPPPSPTATPPPVAAQPTPASPPAAAPTPPAALPGRSAGAHGDVPDRGVPDVERRGDDEHDAPKQRGMGSTRAGEDDDAPKQRGMGSTRAGEDERGTSQGGMASPLARGGGAGDGAASPRGLSGDHDYASSTRTDAINRCVRARGGQISVTLSNGDSCTYSAARGGWVSACSDPMQASLALGRSCQ